MARYGVFIVDIIIGIWLVEMFVEAVDELPVLQELAFGNLIDIKRKHEPLLLQNCLHLFEVVGISVFILGVP